MNSVTTLWTIWSARYWILIVACVAATGAAFVGASPTGATDRVGSMTASSSGGASSSRTNYTTWSHDSPPR
jgi:hypothetical protein